MRLTQAQINAIVETVSRLTDGTAAVYVFGSRVDDHARGGDVDVLVETNTLLTLMERAQIKMELESLLNLPVDVISKARNAAPTPFQRIAGANAVKLEMR